jgi:hypothetical protein
MLTGDVELVAGHLVEKLDSRLEMFNIYSSKYRLIQLESRFFYEFILFLLRASIDYKSSAYWPRCRPVSFRGSCCVYV